MLIYIPDETPYHVIAQICVMIGHDWDKSKASRWTCRRCQKKRRAK